MYADGYNNEKRHEVKIRLSIKDEEFLLKLRDKIYPNKDRPLYYYNRNNHKYCELYICNKKLSFDLSKHGCCQAKTFSITFPYFLEEKYYNHFIRGVFDGDGCICLTTLKTGEHKTMFSIIGNRPFMQQINQIIADKCGLYCNKLIDYKGKDERIATFAFSGCRQCIKIREYLYKNATIFMKRKHDKFMLLGTNKWKTYENLRKKVVDNKSFVFCYNCNKKLTYRNKIHYKNSNVYCNKCYNNLFVVSKKRKSNDIIIKEGTSIMLIKGNVICFDTEDIDIIEKHKWYIENNRVVSRQSKPRKCFYLNRLIMNAKDGQSVAFRDGNHFNMKKENLEKRDHR